MAVNVFIEGRFYKLFRRLIGCDTSTIEYGKFVEVICARESRRREALGTALVKVGAPVDKSDLRVVPCFLTGADRYWRLNSGGQKFRRYEVSHYGMESLLGCGVF